MTLKELLEGRELPVKIRVKDWFSECWFEAVYKHDNIYYGHNYLNLAQSYSEDFSIWELYEEPKKKIKLKKFMIVDMAHRAIEIYYFENYESARKYWHESKVNVIEIPNEEIEVDEDIFK